MNWVKFSLLWLLWHRPANRFLAQNTKIFSKTVFRRWHLLLRWFLQWPAAGGAFMLPTVTPAPFRLSSGEREGAVKVQPWGDVRGLSCCQGPRRGAGHQADPQWPPSRSASGDPRGGRVHPDRHHLWTHYGIGKAAALHPSGARRLSLPAFWQVGGTWDTCSIFISCKIRTVNWPELNWTHIQWCSRSCNQSIQQYTGTHHRELRSVCIYSKCTHTPCNTSLLTLFESYVAAMVQNARSNSKNVN